MSTAYRDGIPRTPAPDNEVAPEVAPELRPTANSWLESLGYGKEPGQREHIGLPSQTPGAKLGIAESGKHMPSEGTLSRFMASISVGSHGVASAAFPFTELERAVARAILETDPTAGDNACITTNYDACRDRVENGRNGDVQPWAVVRDREWWCGLHRQARAAIAVANGSDERRRGIETATVAAEIARMADQLPPAKLEAAIAAYLDEMR